MNLFVTLKAFADLCLYAGGATVVALWFGSISSLFPQTICCTLGVAVAILLQKRGFLSYLGIPVACSCFLLCTYVSDVVAVIPMVIYCAALICKKQFHLEYDAYSNFFPTSLFVIAGMIFFAGINLNWSELFPYIWAYLFVAIFLLRQLRMNEGGCQGHWLNVFMMIAILVLCGVICGVLVMWYQYGGIFRWLFSWISGLFKAFAYIVTYVVTHLAHWFSNLMQRIELPDRESDDIRTMITNFAGKAQMLEPNELAGMIWSAVFLLAVLFVAWILGRKLLRMMRGRKTSGSREVYTESIHITEKRRREKSIGNRAKVRAFYRQFLTLVQKRGGKIQPNHTSRDVLQTAVRFVDAEKSNDLRELYLSARYDENTDVTDEQVRIVRKLYHTLKIKK